MNEVHITLQGKGGIGKSLVCRFLGEYRDAVCIDADPENRSLAACTGLQVQEFELLDARKTIDPFAIDRLMESVLDETADIVIDIGAASFVEVSAFWLENDLETVFSDARKDLWMHLIVVGGPSQGACMRTVVDRIKDEMTHGTTNSRTVVWENEYFGPLGNTGTDKSVKEVIDQAGFKRILLPQRGRLFVAALEGMIRAGMTFEEAIASAPTLLGRTRLERQRNELWQQLDVALSKSETVDAEPQVLGS